ncbi:MAG: class I SAM-dependent methyltransferase [Phormidium sp.]|nr:MAG: Methylase involved in ubiquinone/menaquinone biosynthesis [Phormidium sp. OSCR]
MTSTSVNKPAWAGDDWLARLVNQLIATPLLYRLMKQQARRVLIKTAEKNGVRWRDRVAELDSEELRASLASITNPNLTYPDYYQVPFHAYDAGNLCWLAALEAEPATQSMALRVWKDEALSPDIAQQRLRHSFFEAIAPHLPQTIENALDVGCSIGISSEFLHRYLQNRQSQPLRTVGLDLSPHMLAVAQRRDQSQQIHQWVHGNAEATDFRDHSFDVITLQFVLHELPRHATTAIFREMRRILRPGGLLAIVDNNPKSAVIQNLPPALFVLMKSTEPWSDDYYTFDVEETLNQVGLNHIETIPTDPRHRTIIARQVD